MTCGIHVPQLPVTHSPAPLRGAFLSRVITGPLPRTRLAPAPLNLARGPARPSPLVCPKPRVKPDWEQTWLCLCFVFTLKPPWASLIAQLVKNPPAMWETWV